MNLFAWTMMHRSFLGCCSFSWSQYFSAARHRFLWFTFVLQMCICCIYMCNHALYTIHLKIAYKSHKSWYQQDIHMSITHKKCISHALNLFYFILTQFSLPVMATRGNGTSESETLHWDKDNEGLVMSVSATESKLVFSSILYQTNLVRNEGLGNLMNSVQTKRYHICYRTVCMY